MGIAAVWVRGTTLSGMGIPEQSDMAMLSAEHVINIFFINLESLFD